MPPVGVVLPVFTLGFNLILSDPVPFEYWLLFLLPRSSLALLTCGFTSLIIGSGGGAVGVGGNGGGGAGGNGGGVGGEPPPIHIIKFPRLLWILYNQLHWLDQIYT
jgi:hypothetical protein